MTTSIPTPLPDNSVTEAAVENPGAKINSYICLSDSKDTSSCDTKPFSRAFFSTASRLIPFPSSLISIIALEP